MEYRVRKERTARSIPDKKITRNLAFRDKHFTFGILVFPKSIPPSPHGENVFWRLRI